MTSSRPVPGEPDEWLSDGPTTELNCNPARAPNSPSDVCCSMHGSSSVPISGPTQTTPPSPVPPAAAKQTPPVVRSPASPASATLAFGLGPGLSSSTLSSSASSCEPSRPRLHPRGPTRTTPSTRPPRRSTTTTGSGEARRRRGPCAAAVE